MSNLSLNLEYTGVEDTEIMNFKDEIFRIHNMMNEKATDQKEFLGWLNLPVNYDKEEFQKIKDCSNKIIWDSDILVVIGIGGSYLGARAVIAAITNTFYNILPSRKTPEILYAGNNISPNYLNDLLEHIGDRNFSINVISKSGTTTEPGIAFRVFRNLLEKKYGKEEARKRIYVTTDKEKGGLKALSDKEGYETFVIPNNVGGRFSVLTAVGLLPIAVAGVDIEKIMRGAEDARNEYNNPDLEFNNCYKYAVLRNILYRKNKDIEILVNYEPKFHYFTEWWKQLFGESEGKDGLRNFSSRM